jgi:hypothetical protein
MKRGSVLAVLVLAGPINVTATGDMIRACVEDGLSK